MRITGVIIFVLLSAAVSFGEEIVTNSGGKKIILHDNFTWEYQDSKDQTGDVKDNVRSDAKELILTKNDGQTAKFANKKGKYTVYFDTKKWNRTKDIVDSAEFGIKNVEATGYGMVIYDGLEIPMENMEKAVITNAQNVDKNAAIINIEKCVVNGAKGEIITYTASNGGIDFLFYALVTSSEKGTIQFTFYTLKNKFEELKLSFQEAMSGLVF